MHIQLLINIIQENNWVTTTKNVKGKLLLIHGNGERVNINYCWNLAKQLAWDPKID